MNDNRHTTTIRTQARALRQRWLQHLLALLCLLTAGGAGEAWATVTTIYERGGSGTAWSAADLTDWTANVANT